MDWEDEYDTDDDDSYWLSNADPRWVKGLQRSVTLFFYALILNSLCLGIFFWAKTSHDLLNHRAEEIDRKMEAATVKLPPGPVGNGSIRVERFDEDGKRVAYNIDSNASDNAALAEAGQELEEVASGMKSVLLLLILFAPVLLLVGILTTWSIFLLTAREPGTSGDDGLERWRTIMRIAPFVVVPILLMKPFVGNLDVVFKLAASTIGYLVFIGQEKFLRTYAWRIPDGRLAETTRKVMDWMVKLPLAAIAVILVTGIVAAPFLQKNSTIFLTIIAILWAVLLVRYLVLLWQYRTTFRNVIRGA